MDWNLLRGVDVTWITGAAVVGFVGSLTIAVINAVAARRLERAKSLRDYRSRLCEDFRDYARSTAAIVGGHRMLVAVTPWATLGDEPKKWIFALHKRSVEKGAVHSPAEIIAKAGDVGVRAQKALANEIIRSKGGDDPSARVRLAMDLLLNAYGAVEEAIEVFVYGGLRCRLRLRARLHRLNQALDKVEALQRLDQAQ